MSPQTAPDISPERIDRLQRRRTRITFAQFLLFAVWQGNFLALRTPPDTGVAGMKLSAYVVWCVILLLFIRTGGGWLQPRAVRRILDDESTRAHRAQATSLGFWVASAAALACYAVNLVWPLSAMDVAHAVLTSSLGTALVAFGVLERRAQADA